MQDDKTGVTLNLEINTDTVTNCAKKIESLSRIIERLSEEDVLRGMVRLAISAKIV
jgi:hypothetical protein